ncbi:hypothetical protein C162_26705 [Paenibacillus sp. FSL R7-269]|uniref:hypothetical protein n=1 Tax=Paenibacillus sp. FSL R7-269 TaxID=1226755 RepID=UPI0003E1EBB8|nr:hypothetical protein [Paenibacillus sp. FSL R7-269]ETT40917.1 hypothetical protein C162_26705 [Paenibacillus sp. FSL R7-269]
MWPFKRKPPHEHDWRLDDTFMKPGSVDPRLRAFFVIQCTTCDKQRTLTEDDFAHFRKYFNVKLTEVSPNA